MIHHNFEPYRTEVRTIRPVGLYAISGLTTDGQNLFAIDKLRGYLVEINPKTNNTTVLNPTQTEQWLESSGLAMCGDQVWFAQAKTAFWVERLGNQKSAFSAPQEFCRLSYPINGIAVNAKRVYLTSQKSGYIHVFDQETGQSIQRFPQPGVGPENITWAQEKLWVSDQLEQTVYCLNPDTGEVEFSILTPFLSPTGIAFVPNSSAKTPQCYVSYADQQPYIRDDPNADPSQTIAWRDRTFIHPLEYCHHAEAHYTLSNGYLIEMSYVEELQSLDPIHLEEVEWRIALPSQTLRQRVRHIEPIGHPFTLEEKEGEQIAVFKFDQLEPDQCGLFGWKAIIEVFNLKYSHVFNHAEASESYSEDFQQRYLSDNDDLAMETPIIQAAAKVAVGTETHMLRKMHKIRNYVYDQLSYGIQPRIDTPDVVLERGIGSCGEYVGLLLALARLNGIPCRTIGRYKCPLTPEIRGLPLEPDFNHVWIEFYVPGMGWLPMESNVDDVNDRGPYPDRFFMGLAWYHLEIGKGISFEKMTAKNKPEKLPLGDLALNHIRFRILDELSPTLVDSEP